MPQRIFRLIACVAVALGVLLPATVASAEPTTEQQLDKAYDELEHVIEDYNRIGEQLTAAQAAAADIEQKLGGLQARVDATQGEVTRFAVTAYKGGGNLSATRFLLAADDSASMARQVAAMERVSRSRQRDIAGFAAAKAQFETQKKQLADLIAAQTQQRAALAAKKTAIEAEIKRLERIEAGMRNTRPSQTQSSGSNPPPPSGSGKGAIAVQYAYAQLGKMYLYGAAGPDRFDCSGLTQQAWKRAGISLPHNAAQQHQRTAKVTRAQLQPGDLVYYNGFGHVGIYVGSNQIIHASRAGQPVALRGIQNPIAYSRPG